MSTYFVLIHQTCRPAGAKCAGASLVGWVGEPNPYASPSPTLTFRLRIIISKKPLINQPHRANITGIRKGVLTFCLSPMRQVAVTIGKKCCLRSEQSSRNQFIYSIFSLLISLSMPLGATAQSLEAISGPTHGKSGDILTFVVEARDSDGNPQSEVEVLFGRSPSDDTSDLGTYSTTTRVGGRAKTTLILENNAIGIYRISAWRTDNNFTAIFNVTIDPAPPPRSIRPQQQRQSRHCRSRRPYEKISGDNQEGVAGAVLADPFVVEVRDEDGEPLRRITVTFTITAGRGAMSVVTSTTDSDGRVASVMTLSSEPGLNRVQVGAEGISQTVVFNAEGTVPLPEPMVE